MKILLTGYNGFLGSVIYKQLSKNNELFTLGKPNDSDFRIDLKNTFNLNYSFDLIIHAAGKAHSTTKNYLDCLSFFNINVNGTINLLNSFQQNKLPKYFVFISSVSVYGLDYGLKVNEKAGLNAKDPYGMSKIFAETIVRMWCDRNNVKCTIIRLPLIVGVNPPGNLGSMIQGIKRGYYFNIAGGNAKKSMVLASDIAKYILKAAEVGGTFNLTDGLHPTFNELSKSISRNLDISFLPNMPLFIAKVLAKIGNLFGNALPINSNKLSKITSTLTFDDSKARIAFGWNPTPVIKSFKLHEDAL